MSSLTLNVPPCELLTVNVLLAVPYEVLPLVALKFTYPFACPIDTVTLPFLEL